MNYYNEFDPHAAAWLRQLIAEGLIPQGEVDQRSITDVRAADLSGFTQCHFFAGIAGWSFALQLAGWPADRPVWTGSCPCQPFSVAGKGKGTADERHLWPDFFRLIRECRPDTIFGEQVASPDALLWLDGVCADLETEDYAVGAVPLGAHSVNAPHQRQRLYWVADAQSDYWRSQQPAGSTGNGRDGSAGGGPADAVANSAGYTGPQHEHEPGTGSRRPTGAYDAAVCGGAGVPVADTTGQRAGSGNGREHCGGGFIMAGTEPWRDIGHSGKSGPMANRLSPGLEGLARHGDGGDEPRRLDPLPAGSTSPGGSDGGMEHPESDGRIERGPESGRRSTLGRCPWDDFQLILCRDGKLRRIPTEPALFPLADGLPYKLARRRSARAPLLRGAGNAIVPQAAALFIEAFAGIEYEQGRPRF